MTAQVVFRNFIYMESGIERSDTRACGWGNPGKAATNQPSGTIQLDVI